MIASVRGTVIDKGPGHLIVEAAGIGHLISCTARTAGSVSRDGEAFVLTQLVVREDAMVLYGFATAEEREMFGLLQTVSKLGPKIALAVLEALAPAEIAAAVAGDDAVPLTRAVGVGKRMAERIVLELKEKVAAFADPAAVPAIADDAPSAPVDSAAAQVVEALTGLGFREPDAEAAVAAVLADDPAADTPTALRRALAGLGRG